MSIRQGNNIIAGIGNSTGNPDEITITINEYNELQAEGVLDRNKNIPKFDWVGTSAEYSTQNIETTHPEWICYITDDLNDPSESLKFYTKEEVDKLISSKSYQVGCIMPFVASADYIPDGFVKADGAEYPKDLFPGLWDNYIITKVLDTCTYEEYQQFITDKGACAKFAIDKNRGVFKVPFIPDGYYIKQGQGTSNKAGLPNIKGSMSPLCTWDNVAVTDGAISPVHKFNVGVSGGGATLKLYGFDFNASLSNPIYGASDTVDTNAVGLRWFIFLSNSMVNKSDFDWARFMDGVNSKADKDLNNVSSNIDIVTEYKINEDNSWYRIYNSGWVEQGGIIKKPTNGLTTINLIKPFKTSNYMPIYSRNAVLDTGGYTSGIQSVTTTSFKVQMAGADPNVNYGAWFACGQGV